MYQAFSFSSLSQALQISLSNVLAAIIGFIPQLIAAMIIILVGTIIASWVKRIVQKILRALHPL